MTNGADYTAGAGKVLEDTYGEPMSLEDFVDTVVMEEPEYSHVTQSAKYLLDAIESQGTRTVIEEGEEKTRYRFFDDPENNGEHAVLGNTDVLNDWVDSLRNKAAERGDKNQEITWFVGPTATGKSELKRCLINGLKDYSKTDEGKRYTLEWNVNVPDEMYPSDRMMADGGTNTRHNNWYDSPVQTVPLAAYPDEVVEEILDDLNNLREDSTDIVLHERLDPFSQAAYDELLDRYRNQGMKGEELAEQVLGPDHVRAKNYVVDIGRGIGVLHAEDGGRPKQKLVGEWIPQLITRDNKGQKDPRAYSYEGILSQGNKGLTIIEDAIKHEDVLHNLLNVIDEQEVKLGIGTPMGIDTQLVAISNPDLEAHLTQAEDRKEKDPLRALRRRMDKYRLRYLTNYSLERDLIRRGVTNDTDVIEYTDYEDIAAELRSPLHLAVETNEGQQDRELAPHSLESAAMYDVVTRLTSDLPAPTKKAQQKHGIDDEYAEEISYIEKALLFDRGTVSREDTSLRKDEFDWQTEARAEEGKNGIPVTYTTSVIADMLLDGQDRRHSHVIMPQDVLREMTIGLTESAVFSDKEADKYAALVDEVVEHVYEQQQEDVIEAIMHNKRADEDTVIDYVKHAQAWVDDQAVVKNDGSQIEPDLHLLRDVEIEHLGVFGENDYALNGTPNGDNAYEDIQQFRRQNITNKISEAAEKARKNGETFDIESYATEIPVIKNLLESNTWKDVNRLYNNFEPRKWNNPIRGTETAEIKDEAIQNMVDLFDYTEESAELTSWAVIAHEHEFDDNLFREEEWL